MTATDLRELSAEDLPMSLLSGTGYKRRRYYVRFSNAAGSYTLSLATYDAKFTGIEGYSVYTINDAGTTVLAGTWSTTTFTFGAGQIGTGMIVIHGYYT